MISDVLCEALEEISRYQTEPVFAKSYESLKQEIRVLTTVMEAVLIFLDMMPPDQSVDEARTALQGSIRKIDISEIERVVHRIKERR